MEEVKGMKSVVLGVASFDFDGVYVYIIRNQID